jgi:hypothetical protein
VVLYCATSERRWVNALLEKEESNGLKEQVQMMHPFSGFLLAFSFFSLADSLGIDAFLVVEIGQKSWL